MLNSDAERFDRLVAAVWSAIAFLHAFIVELVIAVHGGMVEQIVLLLKVETQRQLIPKPHSEEIEFGVVEAADCDVLHFSARFVFDDENVFVDGGR